LTRKGRSVYAATDKLQAEWANRLARRLSVSELESATHALEHLSRQLTMLNANDRRRTGRRSYA
jgi:hypothetical protein